MRLSLVAIYEGGAGVGPVALMRTSDPGLLRLVAEHVRDQAGRAAGALGIFDETAALCANSDAEAASAVLEIIGKD